MCAGFVPVRIIPGVADAKQRAKPQNRPTRPQRVTVLQVAQDAELVAMISGIIRSSAAEMHGRTLRTLQTMNTTYSDFAATLAEIRTALTDLAFDKDKADRTVMMRAAAAIAMFESDTLRKAAGPILPGEFQA
jgi:hypothetical protein